MDLLRKQIGGVERKDFCRDFVWLKYFGKESLIILNKATVGLFSCADKKLGSFHIAFKCVMWNELVISCISLGHTHYK